MTETFLIFITGFVKKANIYTLTFLAVSAKVISNGTFTPVTTKCVYTSELARVGVIR